MIDRREVLPDVCPQHVAIAARELLQPIDRPMRALAEAVGVAVGDEYALEARLDDRAQRVVHDPVAKSRRADLAPLRLVDEEVGVGAGPVRAVPAVRRCNSRIRSAAWNSKAATARVRRLPSAARSIRLAADAANCKARETPLLTWEDAGWQRNWYC